MAISSICSCPNCSDAAASAPTIPAGPCAKIWPVEQRGKTERKDRFRSWPRWRSVSVQPETRRRGRRSYRRTIRACAPDEQRQLQRRSNRYVGLRLGPIQQAHRPRTLGLRWAFRVPSAFFARSTPVRRGFRSVRAWSDVRRACRSSAGAFPRNTPHLSHVRRPNASPPGLLSSYVGMPLES